MALNIELAGTAVQPMLTTGNSDLELGGGYAALLEASNSLFASGGAIKTLNIDAGTLSNASYAKVGSALDGQIITAADVTAVGGLLSKIAAYCRSNGVSVTVGAQLDIAPAQDWTYQWLAPAVAAGLPVTQVENVDEPELGASAGYARVAANEALIVHQIVQALPGVKIGQWEGGSTASEDAWRAAYDSAAAATGLPGISYVVADTSWNSPQTTSPASYTAWLQSVAQDAVSHGLGLKVLVGGVNTDVTATQWTAQVEQHAADLSKIKGIGSPILLVQSWQAGQPAALLPVDEPDTAGNAATEIAATYPLYGKGLITSTAIVGIAKSEVVNGAAGKATSLGSMVRQSPISAQGSFAIVVSDQTGLLHAPVTGGASVTSLNPDTLVLNGSLADVEAELRNLTVTEPVSGADTVDVETFNSAGRIADAQTQVLTLPTAAHGSAAQVRATASSGAWNSVSAGFGAAGAVSKLTYSWASATSSRTTTLHQPLAEPGLTVSSSGITSTAANPASGSASALPIGMSAWNPNAFNATQATLSVPLLSTTLAFGPDGELETATDILAPSNPTAALPQKSAPDYLATGGTRVTCYNTGSNPAWQGSWGSDLASVSTVYGSSRQVLEQTSQGGMTDPWYSLTKVFDPYTGALWEQIQTLPPPAGFASFDSVDVDVTQYNTGDNPNWDHADWGGASHVTVTWQDYYATAVSKSSPAAHVAPEANVLSATPVPAAAPILAAVHAAAPITAAAPIPAAAPVPPTAPVLAAVHAAAPIPAAAPVHAAAPVPQASPAALPDMLVSDGSSILWTDTTVGQSGSAAGQALTGPSDGLRHLYATSTDDSFAIVARDPAFEIVDAGNGENAISVTGDDNVISTYHGSKFISLNDGANDQVFLNVGSGALVWDTVNSFEATDSVTIWGFNPKLDHADWIPDAGAVGSKGLTLDITAGSSDVGRLTLAGLSSADTGFLKMSTGSEGGLSYLRLDHS